MTALALAGSTSHADVADLVDLALVVDLVVAVPSIIPQRVKACNKIHHLASSL